MLTAGDASADYTYTYDSLGRVTQIEQDISGLDPTVTLTAEYDAAGRFNRLDTFAGNMQDPQSLHKYLYCHASPVNGIDPTGEFFSLILGSLFDANLQSNMANFYQGAFEASQYGLQAMDSYYNLKLLKAMSWDRGNWGLTATAMSVLPVLAAIANDGGLSLPVSKIVGMTSADWSLYIQKTYGYLAPANRAGRVAENLASAWLKSRGYTNIIAIQNASSHGIDLIARHGTGNWVAFEVKGHIKGGTARLKGLQRLGAEGFAKNVLERISARKQGWGNISKETRAAAYALRDYLKSGKSLRGVVINVENALDAVSVVIRTKIWKAFV
jgi:Holliday junction resolvase-like predicted endonuclease